MINLNKVYGKKRLIQLMIYFAFFCAKRLDGKITVIKHKLSTASDTTNFNGEIMKEGIKV